MTNRTTVVLLLGVALALFPATIDAGTYRSVDAQGNVTYSDRPPQSQDARTGTPGQAVAGVGAEQAAAVAGEVEVLDALGVPVVGPGGRRCRFRHRRHLLR